MNILFYFGHPSHYHLFKNTIKYLKSKDIRLEIVIKSKDILESLLVNDNIEYLNILPEGRRDGKLNILYGLLKRDYRLAKILLGEKIDLLIGSEPALAHIGKLYNIPVLMFVEDDSHIVPEFARLTYPFVKYIISPASCDLGKWSHKKIQYNGFQKLAYLHPEYFKPDRQKVNTIFNKKRNFLIRVSKLSAYHDDGISGITSDLLDKIIAMLSPEGNVFISSEEKLSSRYSEYELNIVPNDIHHFLYYTDLLISDSQSMSVESSLLGTPSIRFNDFVGKIGVLEELEHNYELTYGIKSKNSESLPKKILELISIPHLKKKWRIKCDKMLSEKIIVTNFLNWLIEYFPQSIEEIKSNPDIQWKFKYIK